MQSQAARAVWRDTSSMKVWPKSASLRAPTPGMVLKCSRVTGRREAISRRVTSEKMI